jgi:hypothetical protein
VWVVGCVAIHVLGETNAALIVIGANMADRDT